jgi:Ca2+/Na+ antiporter
MTRDPVLTDGVKVAEKSHERRYALRSFFVSMSACVFIHTYMRARACIFYIYIYIYKIVYFICMCIYIYIYMKIKRGREKNLSRSQFICERRFRGPLRRVSGLPAA